MAGLDLRCWIKLVHEGGWVLADGDQLTPPAKVTVRYTMVNDSDVAVGPFTVVGALKKNGQRIKPNGQPNVVPAQQVTIPPNAVWTRSYVVSETDPNYSGYAAAMLVDVGDFIDEDDEKNNLARRTFSVMKPVA